MENRFGIKDFFLFLLIGTLIVLVSLSMVQFDRQWRQVQAVQDKLDSQSRDIRALQNMLARGVSVRSGSHAAPTTQRAGEMAESFSRMRQARSMPDYAEGDWLVEAFPGTLAKLTPLISRDNAATTVQTYVLETLCDRDPDTLEWRGHIARSWQVSPDGLKISFQMRDDVVFSDGHPLSPSDVVFTFNWIMNEKVATPRFRAYLRVIDKVEQSGPNEVLFTFKEPYFQAFELAGSLPILPEHFYGKYTPEEFNQSVGLLLGSGPYKLADPTGWKPGAQIVLVRNDRYWGVPGAFDRLIYKQVSQDVARLTQFRNGEIDTFSAVPEQYVEMLKDKALVDRTQHFEYLSPLGGYRYVAWNQVRDGKPTAFADKRVRQAMTMLVDRDRLIQDVMLGYGVVASGPFNPSNKQSNPNVKPLSYDVSRARQLLKEAGYEDRNGDGVLEGGDGKPFEVRLTYPTGSSSYDKQALFLKDAYARAGIVLIPDPLEWGAFSDRLRNKNFEAISLMWTTSIESDIYQMFHSSQSVAGGDNFISYKNEELDRLLEQARGTVDAAKRMQLWNRCHEILAEDQPYTFLFFPKSLPFIDNRIRNVQVTRLGLPPGARLEWYVPLPQQRWTR